MSADYGKNAHHVMEVHARAEQKQQQPITSQNKCRLTVDRCQLHGLLNDWTINGASKQNGARVRMFVVKCKYAGM
jgi:hypothetical protein